MKVNILMMLAAIVAGVFGIGFVLMPGEVLSIYGVTPDVSINYMSQLFGAALILVAVCTWVAKDAPNSEARRAIIMGIFIGDTVGFVVALMGQLGNAVNMLGWSTVAIYLFFALSFGYIHFTSKSSA